MARDPVKSARRADGRALRRTIAAARDTSADDIALATHVLALVDDLGLGPGAVVTSYASIPGEPPTSSLNATLAERGLTVLLPITLPDLDLDWHDAVDPAQAPLGGLAIGRADLVLAPGLAVDGTGTRMGQGGGCYDRALPRRRPGTPVVVVLHPGELVGDAEEPLPRAPHDQPVDAVVTADGLTDLGVSPWRPTPPA
ncbi:5-formyltetrahydrofolate cyclo-ligase [Oryzobacter telluris]|uniref:5-formyltetrahydrofolate cyclo-ligase n=1 Tax=Oryzobacter telluris TaxID=3149179 RepID=UPI00370D6804